MANNLGNKAIMANNIRHYMRQNNISRNELSEAIGVPYTTVTDWLKANSYPRIDKIEMMAAYFNITKALLVEERNLSSETTNALRVPILGRIPAGIPLEAIEDIIGYEEISIDRTLGGKEYFALQICGDSMSPKYLEGDIVIFLVAQDCDSGSECAVIKNGNDATFKKVIKQISGIVLQPLNTGSYSPEFFSNEEVETLPISIIGVAIELRRKT